MLMIPSQLQKRGMNRSLYDKTKALYKYSFLPKPDRLRKSSEVELQAYLLNQSADIPTDYSKYNQMIRISDEMQEKQYRNRYRYILESYGLWMDQHFELVKLQSNWLLLWNLLNFFSIVYFFVIMVLVVFVIIPDPQKDVQRINQQWNIVTKYVVACILTVDLLAVRHRVRVVVQGKVTASHAQIMDNYLKSYFLVDAVSLLILWLDIGIRNMNYFLLIFIIKLLVAFEISNQIFYKLLGHKIISPIVRFLRVIFLIAFVTFLFACIFTMIDLNYLTYQNFYRQFGFLYVNGSSQLQDINLYQNFDWYVWFQYALYFTVQMAVGCGYGVPTPLNPVSQLVFNIGCLTTKVIFAIYINQVIDTVDSFNQPSEDFMKALVLLNVMNQQEHLSSRYRAKVRSYFRKRFDKSMETWKYQQFLQQILSEKRLREFKGFYKQHFLMRMTFFHHIVHNDPQRKPFQFRISSIIRSKLLCRDDVVMEKGTLPQEKLYLCQWSTIKVSNQGIDLAFIDSSWNFFGLRQFFIDKKALFDAVAYRSGFVQYIEKKDFMREIKLFPNIYFKYCQEIDRIRIEGGSTQQLQLRCWQCNGLHLYEHCPFLKQWFSTMIPLSDLSSNQESEPPLHNQRKSIKRKQYPKDKYLKFRYRPIDSDVVFNAISYFPSHNIS